MPARARKHAGSRPVDRAQRDPLGKLELILIGGDREHRPAGGKRAHELGAGSDQLCRVFERQHPRDVGGGELAHRVADQIVGPYAQRVEQPVKGDLQGKEGGLGELGLIDLLFESEDLDPGLIDCLRKDGKCVIEPAPHPRPLGALAGEQKGGLAGEGALRRKLTAQGLDQCLAIRSRDAGAPFELRAAGGEGIAGVKGGDLGVFLQVLAKLARLRAHRGLALARQKQRHYRNARQAGGLGPLGWLPTAAQDDVAVRPSHPKRAHPGDTRLRALRPRLLVTGHSQPQIVERDLAVRRFEVNARDQLAVPQAEGCLDQSRDPGRTFEMADVRLDRADRDAPAVATLPEGLPECGRLDRIPDRRPRAVQLHVVDVFRVDAGALERRLDHPRLGGATGDRQPGGGAGVGRAAMNRGVGAAAVRAGLPDVLEHDHTAAFPAHVPVGARVKRIAATVRRQGAELGHEGAAERREDEVDARDECHVALPPADCLAGEVSRDQRRGLARVDGDAGPVESERVGDPVGDHAAPQTGEGMPRHRRAIGGSDDVRIVGSHRADVDADAPAIRTGDDARVLEALPGELERNPLLRVHGRGLVGGYAEEVRVESVDVVDPSRA